MTSVFSGPARSRLLTVSATVTAAFRAVAVMLLVLSVASSAAWAAGAELALGKIIVVDPNAGPPPGKANIVVIDPATGAQTMISSGNLLEETAGIALDPIDGYIWVADRINGIIKVNPATGEQTLVTPAGSGTDFFSIKFDSMGQAYIIDTGFDPSKSLDVPGRVLKVNRSTGALTLVAQGGNIVHPYGLAIDNNDNVVITDMSSFGGQGAVLQIDPSNGQQTVLWGPASVSPTPTVIQAPPLGCPMGITVEQSGNIVVTSFTYPGAPAPPVYGCSPAGIFRLNLATGAQEALSTNPPVSWQVPFGIDTEVNNNIIVADELWSAVYRLTPGGQFLNAPLTQYGYLQVPVNLQVIKFLPINGFPKSSNTAPTLSNLAASPNPVNENSSTTLSGTIVDPDAGDGHTVTINWGDSSSPTSISLAAGALNFSAPHTYLDNAVYSISITVADASLSGTGSATVTVNNVAPTVTINGAPASSVVGVAINLTSTVSDPSPVDSAAVFTYAWTVTRNGNPFASGAAGSLSFTPNASGTYAVNLTVTDKNGGAGTASKTINVVDLAPTVTINGAPVTSGEGTAITLTSTVTGSGTLTYLWNVTKNGNPFVSASGTSLTFTPDDNGTFVATLAVTNSGGTGTDSKSINVTNALPVITSVTGPLVPLALGASTTITTNFTDAGKDTHTCSISWDDGSTTAGSVTETNGNGSCTGTRTFAGPGVYSIAVTVTDDDTGAATGYFKYVVVYDPTEGSVNGSGWIMSPAGAYLPNPALVGKAHFGFQSKYLKGTSVPTGKTEFQFKAGKFKFKSTVYEWLVISGHKAQYKGSGTIRVHNKPHAGDDDCEDDYHFNDDKGAYSFILTAQDGQRAGSPDGLDRFRIKIVDKANGTVVYDNRRGDSDDMDITTPTAIGGGRITIQKQ